jgi:ABC-type Fe3+-hydroxamate transport system substrate-binding protein
MAVSKNTFINELLEINKFDNIVASTASRYPEIDLEQLKEADLI